MRFKERFLLTRPSRGVTEGRQIYPAGEEFLLTRPSRGVTRVGVSYLAELYDFYSHAPRGA